MARRKSRTLTEVELEFMHVVWAAQEVGTDDVQRALRKKDRDLSDGSVRKVLSILLGKGYVSRRREGRGFIYKATVPEGSAHGCLVADLLRRAFGGSAALMVASLLDTDAVSDEELDEIKRLIAERESQTRGGAASGDREGGGDEQ